MRYDTARLADFSVLRGERRQNSFDRSFFALVMILLLLGIIMVLSASFPRAYYDPGHVTGGRATYYFVRQLIFAAAGVGAMLLAARFPIGFYKRYAKHFMAVTLVLLALVPLIGIRANGSRRWLGVGSLTVQPSELAKLAVILLFAAMISRRRGNMKSFRTGILPFALILGLIVGLLVLEPHFSASIIILALGAAMLFLGGAPLGWFLAAFGAGGAALAVLLVFSRTPPAGSQPGAIRFPARLTRGIRSYSPSIRSAPAGSAASGLGRVGRSISICRKNTMTLFFPSCARNWVFWEQPLC